MPASRWKWLCLTSQSTALPLNQSERLAEVMYRVLLRELDYAEDWTIANLEMTLEADGRLDDFIKRFEDKYKAQFGESTAYSKLHRRPPAIARPAPSCTRWTQRLIRARITWAKSPSAQSADISVRRLVEDTYELMSRRRTGKAAMFIIDEVGQYIARAVLTKSSTCNVREFGYYGRNIVLKRKAIAPVWIVVTSQEKLDEVVAAINSKTRGAGKVTRFHSNITSIWLPQILREVASRRVLTKTDAGEKYMASKFQQVLVSSTHIASWSAPPQRSFEKRNSSSFIHTCPRWSFSIPVCIGSPPTRGSSSHRRGKPHDYQTSVRNAG